MMTRQDSQVSARLLSLLDGAEAKNMFITIELYEMICTEAIFVIEHKKMAPNN